MIDNNRLFLDVHVLQTLPPSNINRDDTGSPKSAQYGGVRRARVSSQSWKKAMRDYFYKNSEQSNVGIRSLDIVEYLKRVIMKIDPSIENDKALQMSEKVINTAGVKTKDNRAKALFFLGHRQARELAKAAIEGNHDKKVLQEILRNNPAIDIALFGRMVADDPSLNEDASSQVAHAISTHAVQTEFDFFTAVDDLSPEDNAGAGMLGTVEFNTSTLYRYANVAVHELNRQLNGSNATVSTLKLFVKAFSNSLPTGKVNTFANQTLPQAIFVVLRTDRPVNLVSAFEEPIKSCEGYVNRSIARLFEEQMRIQKFVSEPFFAEFVVMEEANSDDRIGTEKTSLSSLLKDLEESIHNFLATNE